MKQGSMKTVACLFFKDISSSYFRKKLGLKGMTSTATQSNPINKDENKEGGSDESSSASNRQTLVSS